MSEQCVQFGDDDGIGGIVCQPDDGARGKDRPAFILVNSGLLHRVGPFRMYVNLSRRLAADGFLTLRMDLSGKGESEPRRGAQYDEAVIADITEAMNMLETRFGFKQFVIGGICTGADNAYLAGFNDKRVCGLIPLDGYAYRTFGFYRRHYGPKLLSIGKILGFVRRKAGELLSRLPKAENQEQPVVQYRMMFPPRDEYRRKMKELLARDVRLLIAFTGGWAPFYNYENQFKDGFSELNRHQNITVKYYPLADHCYILGSDRELVTQDILNWASSAFPASVE